MKRREFNIVSINSRKGGVGKTAVGLSAAAQLAARGKKVAFIDLDAQGAHLAQCLPFAGVAAEDGDHLAFQFEDLSGSPPVSYRERPYLFWWLIGRPDARRRTVLDAGERLLVSKACIRKAEEFGVADGLRTMAENLSIFPASCYVSDLDDVNRMLMASQTQRVYENFLSNLVSTLARDGNYDFVFFDNSPGLSLNGATCLSWAMWLAREYHDLTSSEVRVWAWTTTLASWWEQGLLEYELNVFGEDLKFANPVLIVNRVVGSSWLGKFSPGTCVSVKRLWDDARANKNGAQERLAELKSLFFHVPLWLGADRDPDDLLLDFVIPQNLRVAVLGDDTRVTLASSASREHMPTTSVVDPNAVPAHDSARRWGRRAEEFFARFFLPAVTSCGAAREPLGEGADFHAQVWSTLAAPLLEQS